MTLSRDEYLTAALDGFVNTQIALVDKLFWDAHHSLILTNSISADKMHFDIKILFPKLEQLRNEGRISSIAEARTAAEEIVRWAEQQGNLNLVFGRCQIVAQERLPKK